MIIDGRAVVVPGDDVNTDVLYPGPYLNIDRQTVAFSQESAYRLDAERFEALVGLWHIGAVKQEADAGLGGHH